MAWGATSATRSFSAVGASGCAAGRAVPGLDQPESVSAKSDRQAAREALAAYHEGQLAALVERGGVAKTDPGAANWMPSASIKRYSRLSGAKELWKFCNLGTPEIAARVSNEHPSIDWCERGAAIRR